MKKPGITLPLIGLCVTLFAGFTFIQSNKAIDAAKVQKTAPKENRVEWPPILGLMIMAIGGGFLLGENMKKW